MTSEEDSADPGVNSPSGFGLAAGVEGHGSHSGGGAFAPSPVGQSAPDMRPSHVTQGLLEVAAVFPSRIALADLNTELSYLEVARWSGRLAEILCGELAAAGGDFRACGEPGMWVPVLVRQTARSGVALLAAIHAGVPFVPIDVDMPADRQQSILDRLGPIRAVMVAEPSPELRLPAACRVIHVSDGVAGSFAPTGSGSLAPADSQRPTLEPQTIDRQMIEPQAIDPLAPAAIDPLAPAAIVFTSGSTGRPKGVVIPWRMVEQRLGGEVPTTKSDPDRHLILRRLNFTSGLIALGFLAVGDVVDLLDPAVVSPTRLLELAADRQMTELHTGATIARLMVEAAGGQRRLPLVHQADFGAEPCDWALIAGLRTLCGDDLVVRVSYNATEAGRIVRREVRPDEPIGVGIASPGIPADPSRLRLIPDERTGAPEIWVRDPVSLGYFDDPELDERRFPIDSDGVRWWRSGDVGAIDDEGQLHVRGRVDDMVKINGVRIEPAEAELVLRALPGIADVAVLPVSTPGGRVRLVGHVRLEDSSGEPSADPASVRAALLRVLPPSMVPSMLVRHDELPMTPNGKIDRAKLTSTRWQRWRPESKRGGRSELDYWMASQVAEIIDLGEVDAFEDIFDAGLDSLGAVELCAAIAAAGIGELQPQDLLTLRTPAALVDHLLSRATTFDGSGTTASAIAGSSSAAVVLHGAGTSPPILVLPGAGGTAFAFRSLANELGADQPVIVLEPRGLHVPGAVDTTFDDLVEHAVCDALAALGVWGADGTSDAQRCVVVGYSAGATIGFEVARRLVDAGWTVEMVFLDGSPTRERHVGSSASSSDLGSLSESELGSPSESDLRSRSESDLGAPSESDLGSPSESERKLRAYGAAPSPDRSRSGLVAKLRNRSVGEHARLLPDYWESQRALWRARRLARSPQRLGAQPGQPIYRRERYLAFRIIQSAAVAAHVPEPLAVSAVLVRVDGSRASSFMIRPLVSTLEVVEVGGDHYSVLQYPHVMGVADELRRAVERLDDRRRDRVDRSG